MRRTDEAWLEERWADPATRVLVVAGTRLRPVDGAVDWVAPADAPDGHAGAARRARRRDLVRGDRRPGRRARRARTEWVAAARAAARTWPASAGADAPLALPRDRAGRVALRRPGFCPRCGGALESRARRPRAASAPTCGKPQFPRTDPAVIMVVTHGEPGSDDERCLLGRQAVVAARAATRRWPASASRGRRSRTPYAARCWRRSASPSARSTYFGNQPWPLPASLMLGFVGRARRPPTSTVDGDEIEDARWFTRAEMSERGRGRHARAARRRLDLVARSSSTGTAGRCPAGW